MSMLLEQICVVALICWSFAYASFCAFGLLLYVGYIFFALPSVLTLRCLNPVLLGFILTWALSTYLFNAAFSIMMDTFDMVCYVTLSCPSKYVYCLAFSLYSIKLQFHLNVELFWLQDLDIWHTIGLWHYSTPGLFIFAQFVLGVLVATDIFVSNSIVNNLSEMGHSSSEEASESLEQSEGAFYIYLFLHGCFLTVCGVKSHYHIWFHFYVCNSSLVVFGSYNS